jgi:cellulose synthase (UDP-forming)
MTNTLDHLPKTPTDQEKISYIIKHPLLLKSLYVVSILSWIYFLFGYISFLNNSIIYWIFFGPLIGFMAISQIISTAVNLFYKKFDIDQHSERVKKFWKENKRSYTVDIFLPICGEDIDVLNNTWQGVTTLQNPNYNTNVIVLDDSKSEIVQNLSKKFGFGYLSRPNRGEMKKAGNLKYGFEHSSSEFVLILDADFRPRHDFILDTLPYMSDPLTAIVQTPQFFDNNKDLHNYSALQSGAGNIQEDFYKIIQVARGQFNGAICVGSCALYRRSALNEVGGTAQVEHSEDIMTGFRLKDAGWSVRYLPIILSKGVCPEDIHAFFKQQTRWCSGTMTLLSNSEFWKSRVDWSTKLCYVLGLLFYLSNPIATLISLQSLLVLFFYSDRLSNNSFFIFLPLLITAFIAQYFYTYPNAKIGTIIAHSCASWFYSYTIITHFFGHVEKWQPSGVKGKISEGFKSISKFVTTYLGLYIGSIAVFVLNSPKSFLELKLIPVLFWIAFMIIYNSLFLFSIQKYILIREFSYYSIKKTTVVISSLLFIILSSFYYFEIKNIFGKLYQLTVLLLTDKEYLIGLMAIILGIGIQIYFAIKYFITFKKQQPLFDEITIFPKLN